MTVVIKTIIYKIHIDIFILYICFYENMETYTFINKPKYISRSRGKKHAYFKTFFLYTWNSYPVLWDYFKGFRIFLFDLGTFL